MHDTTRKQTISALVITYNEENMIGACLDTLKWCDHIIVIDSDSTDKTVSIAESKGAKVISFSHPSFARKREEALKRCQDDWVIYIDADERVTPTLATEIMVHVETSEAAAFRIMRENIYFGKNLTYGGWGNDAVERVFKRTALSGWQGDVHESPKYTGSLLQLTSKLIHLTHRDVVSGLYKTARWTPMEAQALFEAGIAPVSFSTLLRKGGMEFLRRVFALKGYKEGMVGLVEATIQAINRVLVYMQVWELQQKPRITEIYEKIDADIKKLWSQEK